MIYRAVINERNSDKELHTHWVKEEDIPAFLKFVDRIYDAKKVDIVLKTY